MHTVSWSIMQMTQKQQRLQDSYMHDIYINRKGIHYLD